MPGSRKASLITAFLAGIPVSALAQTQALTAAEEATLAPVRIEDSRINESLGGVKLDARTLRSQRTNTSDTAKLLDDIPGVSSYGAGGISSLPVVHGLADDRLRTLVDGMDLMTACPNHMNPALSFIDPSKVAKIEVYAGIAPVSVGGDSIGGTIQVQAAPPKFASPDAPLIFEGQAGGFTRSNGNARGTNYSATVANQYLNVSYSESWSESDNYWAASDFKKPGNWKNMSSGRDVPDHEVGASEYSGSLNRELGFALKLMDRHILEYKFGEQRLDYEGFPNQRMDMISSVQDPTDPTGHTYNLVKGKPSNVNRTHNVRYTGQFDWGEFEARLFHQDLKHHMDMLPERFLFMMMPMDTESTTDGGVIKATIDLNDSHLLRVGYDFQKYRLNDWWPPIDNGGMGPNTFWNIRDGKRDRVGVFAEWEARWTQEWMTLLGIRGTVVESDVGAAAGYNNTYNADAARLNNIDTYRKDKHTDATVLTRYSPDAGQMYELGIARKTRSPNLYERYPWSYNSMAALMNNFVGDGNGYIGNPNLKPELAHTLSASGSWGDLERKDWNLRLTGYVTDVRDYIDAVRCTPQMNAACPASNVTTNNSYVKLQYANQRALIKGFDLSGDKALGSIDGLGSFTLSGMLSYVRGENRSTGDNLYHMMPLNLKTALVHKLAGWTNTVEWQYVDDKTRVSHVRNEVTTPNYDLLNLRSSYDWKYARLDIALENALNRMYYLPLGGAYVGQGNSMTIAGIPWGMNVPGRARSLNLGLTIKF